MTYQTPILATFGNMKELTMPTPESVIRTLNTRIGELDLPFEAKPSIGKDWRNPTIYLVSVPNGIYHTREHIEAVKRLAGCFDLEPCGLLKFYADEMGTDPLHPLWFTTYHGQGRPAQIKLHWHAKFGGYTINFYPDLNRTLLAPATIHYLGYSSQYYRPNTPGLDISGLRTVQRSASRTAFNKYGNTTDTRSLLDISYYAPATFDVWQFLMDTAQE